MKDAFIIARDRLSLLATACNTFFFIKYRSLANFICESEAKTNEV